jgi:hypothetical protein
LAFETELDHPGFAEGVAQWLVDHLKTCDF